MDWTMENIHTEVPLEVYLKFSSVSISALTGSSRGDVGTFKDIKNYIEDKSLHLRSPLLLKQPCFLLSSQHLCVAATTKARVEVVLHILPIRWAFLVMLKGIASLEEYILKCLCIKKLGKCI